MILDRKNQNQRGQSLLEVLVGIAVISIVLSSTTALIFAGLLANRVSRENNHAQILIHDMSSAVRGLATIEWRSLWGSHGLVGYWGMDEGVETRLFDPARGNNGNLMNGPTWQASGNCRAGSCLSFDGVNDFVNAGNFASLDVGTGSFTIAFWVFPRTQAGDWSGVLERGGWAGSGYSIQMGTVASNQMHFFFGSPTGWSGSFAPSITLTPNTWNHVAVVVNRADNSGRSFLNAGQVGLIASAIYHSVAETLFIGSRHAGDATFNGMLDEIRVYNRALSATEIAALHGSSGRLHPRNRGGFWSIEEGPETMISPIFGNFARWFILETVQRDSAGNIVTSGGTPDPSTVKVRYRVSSPRGRVITVSEYIARSESRVTMQDDWSGGPGAIGVHSVAVNSFVASTNIDATSTPGVIRMSAPSPEAWLESAVLDTRQIGGVAYNFVMWRGSFSPSMPADAQVGFQIASSNHPEGPWVFMGTDCTTGTRYGNILEGTQRRIVARCHTGHRYFRYRILLTSLVGGTTPVVDDIIIGWSP